MSEERDTPLVDPRADQAPEAGAPVSENEPTDTEVREALDRANGLAAEQPASDVSAAGDATETPAEPVTVPAVEEPAPTIALSAEDFVTDAPPAERPTIAESQDLPSAGPAPVAPSAAAAPAGGGMLIAPDHPMAALYMQTPMPPDIKGNRGAGLLISLLATVAFALVYAGVMALWLAPTYPPSAFFTDGLLPWLISWPFIAAVAAFFVGMALIVLIVGRAGWWAYVLGGFLVAVLVWVAFIGASALFGSPEGAAADLRPVGSGLFGLVDAVGLSVPAIAAAVVAREATVWFGAWIGGRGRRVTRRNAETIAEYEKSLAEAQATPA